MSDHYDIVYLFGFSERSMRQVERLLPILKEQKNKGKKTSLILLLDGVINAISKGGLPESVKELLALDMSLYVMIPDLNARGIALENIQEKIKPIDYLEMVDILDATPKIISWM
ncbi:MAG: sulfurtransferase complex subunit TusB [Promethearchaeota archaeon]